MGVTSLAVKRRRKTMKITFLGDIMLDEEQIRLHKAGEHSFSFEGMIYPLGDIFGDSSFIIANLETPVTDLDEDLTRSPVSFNTPVEILDEIRRASINIVSTANNHCLDRGIQGLKRTQRLIREKELLNLGSHERKEEEHYLILDDGNVRVGIVNFTYGTNAFVNHHYLDRTEEYMVDLLQEQELRNPVARSVNEGKTIPAQVLKGILFKLRLFQGDKFPYERKYRNRRQQKKVKQYIEECRRKSDIVLAYLHFGGQFNDAPIPLAKVYADKCFAYGVDAVIGNHEHLIQRVDSKGDRFLAYSLGNFLSAQGVYSWPSDRMAEYSLAVTLDLEKGGVSKRYFTLFLNRADDEKRIYNIPVYEYLKQNPDGKVKGDVNMLLNRIYGTRDVEYQLKEHYEIR